jgi:hypothetical protein
VFLPRKSTHAQGRETKESGPFCQAARSGMFDWHEMPGRRKTLKQKKGAELPHSTKGRKNTCKNPTLPVGSNQGKLFDNI